MRSPEKDSSNSANGEKAKNTIYHGAEGAQRIESKPEEIVEECYEYRGCALVPDKSMFPIDGNPWSVYTGEKRRVYHSVKTAPPPPH